MELPDRDKHDDEAAAILALLLEQFRSELMRQWKNGRREPEQDYWAKFEREIGDQLAVILFGVFLSSVRFHSGGSELDQQAIDAGIPWSAERARYLSSLITQTSVRWIRELLQDLASGAISEDDVGARLDRIFGKKRAGVIASQVTTISQTKGGEWAMRLLGLISMEDKWETHPELSAKGPCPICAPLDGTPRSFWEVLYPNGPPEPHPISCVCAIRYINSP